MNRELTRVVNRAVYIPLYAPPLFSRSPFPLGRPGPADRRSASSSHFGSTPTTPPRFLARSAALGRGGRPQQPRSRLQSAPDFRVLRLADAQTPPAQAADRRAGSGGRLNGRPVKVVDGSTTQLADTPKNQRRYPQPTTQK